MDIFKELEQFKSESDIFNFLVENRKEINFNSQNFKGDNLFHILAILNSKKIIKILIEEGTNPNILNDRNELPLFKIIENCEFKVIKYFLKNKKLDINSNCEYDNTILHELVIHGINLKICALLVKKGAIIDIMNEQNETPLHVSVLEDDYEAIKFFVKKGANVELKNIQQMTPYDLAKERNDKKAMNILRRK